MRWLTLATALFKGAPVFAEPSEAEDLFRGMEKKVRAPKSLEVAFEAEGQSKAEDQSGALKFKGKAQFGEGNRLRFEAEVAADGHKDRALTLCDGKTLYHRDQQASRAKTWPAEPADAKRLRSYVARAGVLEGVMAFGGEATTTPPKESGLEQRMAVGDFKLGGKKKIGGKEAQVVHYRLTVFKNGSTSIERVAKMAVWIDIETQLPVKRESETKEGSETRTLAETYPTITLDAKIDAKVFELPK